MEIITFGEEPYKGMKMIKMQKMPDVNYLILNRNVLYSFLAICISLVSSSFCRHAKCSGVGIAWKRLQDAET